MKTEAEFHYSGREMQPGDLDSHQNKSENKDYVLQKPQIWPRHSDGCGCFVQMSLLAVLKRRIGQTSFRNLFQTGPSKVGKEKPGNTQ